MLLPVAAPTLRASAIDGETFAAADRRFGLSTACAAIEDVAAALRPMAALPEGPHAR